MKSKKQIGWSSILNREFHMDVFDIERPEFMVLMFGGAGVSIGEYQKRSLGVVPVFNNALSDLEGECSFVFVYITAPYDIRIDDLEDNHEEAERWERHVKEEILVNLPNLPFYGFGYSGGIALAWHGLHNEMNCFGCGALGGDKIPFNIEQNPQWKEPLTIYYNVNDLVYGANKKIICKLEEDELVKCYRKLLGTHDLADYLRNESFAGLVRRANRLYRQ